MSTRSEIVGKRVLNSIDGIETSAHNGVHTGADGARQIAKVSSRWAARQEKAAARKSSQLKRRLEKQAAQLSKAAGKSVDSIANTARDKVAAGNRYARKNPWPVIALTSAAALVAGAVLGRRGR